ncbi:TPA: hypothetical protein NV728_002006 [Escherichia coli]|nr:hypothetical protein [Escherichia coli]
MRTLVFAVLLPAQDDCGRFADRSDINERAAVVADLELIPHLGAVGIARFRVGAGQRRQRNDAAHLIRVRVGDSEREWRGVFDLRVDVIRRFDTAETFDWRLVLRAVAHLPGHTLEVVGVVGVHQWQVAQIHGFGPIHQTTDLSFADQVEHGHHRSGLESIGIFGSSVTGRTPATFATTTAARTGNEFVLVVDHFILTSTGRWLLWR